MELQFKLSLLAILSMAWLNEKGTSCLKYFSIQETRILSHAAARERLDISGTVIIANEPIIVLLGHSCAFIPDEFSYCSSFVDTAPSVSNWGMNFVLPAFQGRESGYLAKLIPFYANTYVTFSNGESAVIESEMSPFSIDVEENETVVVKVDKPVLILQLAKGTDIQIDEEDEEFEEGQSPFGYFVPSLNEMTTEAHFSGFFKNTWVTIVASETSAANTLIDGNVIPLQEWKNVDDADAKIAFYSDRSLKNGFSLFNSEGFIAFIYCFKEKYSVANAIRALNSPRLDAEGMEMNPFISSTNLQQPIDEPVMNEKFVAVFPLNNVVNDKPRLRLLAIGHGKLRVESGEDGPFKRVKSLNLVSEKRIRLPRRLQLSESGNVSKQVVKLWCESECNIVATSSVKHSRYSYSPMNERMAGKKYVAITTPNVYVNIEGVENTFTGHISVVGLHKNTTVTILPSCDVLVKGQRHVQGKELLVNLNAYEVFFLEAYPVDGLDLSGTLVESERPVLFFSGHSCALVPEEYSYCSSFVHALPSVLWWGHSYVLPSFENRKSGFLVKVISESDETSIVLSSGEHLSLDRRFEPLTFEHEGSEVLVMHSDKKNHCASNGKKGLI